MESDQELLRRYARDGSEEAFTELVSRHCNLVWGAARRVLGDSELARDAAQCVFADLSRKAKGLSSGVVLAGWLYRAAILAAAKIARREIRRAQHEQRAMEAQEISQNDPGHAKAAAELQPLLDACLAELSESDRDAVVLRFLSGRSLADVGAALGSNEDAAQKRVSRALEKLRDGFRRRGVDPAGGVVVAALSFAASQAAPAGAAATLASTVLAGSGSISALSLITVMKTKAVVQIVAGLALAGGLVIQHQRVSRLESENEILQGKLSSAAVPEKPQAPAGGGTDQAELQRARQEHDELLRLRGEYALLKNRPQASPDTAGLKTQLEEERAALAAQRADMQKQAAKAEDVSLATGQSRDVIDTLKQVGLMCHESANSHNGVFPKAFGEIDPALLPPQILSSGRMDQFEFPNYNRALTTSDSPQTILIQERVSRQMSNGHFMKCQLNADGSVQTLTSEDGNFSAANGGIASQASAP